MPEEKKTVRKKIAAAADLNNFMRDYYLELDAAAQKGSPKIAWCTSVGPAEILRAFGFQGVLPGDALGHARRHPHGDGLSFPWRTPWGIPPRSAPT